MSAEQGFIRDIIDEVRTATDEPGINAKYDDTKILRYAKKLFPKIYSEMTRPMAEPPVVAYDFDTTSTDETDYVLPPFIEKIVTIGTLDDDNQRESLLEARSWKNVLGPGISVQAGVITIGKNVMPTEKTIRVWYLPTACCELHEGIAPTVAATAITLATTPRVGRLDTHMNAYGGAMIRILGADTNGYIQERFIESYAVTTGIATLKVALSPLPSGDVVYEIAPVLYDDLEVVLGLEVSRHILSLEGNREKLATVGQRYREAMRDLRLRKARSGKWLGDRMRGDTVDHPRYSTLRR